LVLSLRCLARSLNAVTYVALLIVVRVSTVVACEIDHIAWQERMLPDLMASRLMVNPPACPRKVCTQRA
jgi:hypothetical protein